MPAGDSDRGPAAPSPLGAEPLEERLERLPCIQSPLAPAGHGKGSPGPLRGTQRVAVSCQPVYNPIWVVPGCE